MFTICENCENYRKEIYEKNKRLDEFQNIAKKIIQTDLLIQKYNEKEKELQQLKISFDCQKKDCEIIDVQLKKLLKESEKIKNELNELKLENRNLTKKLDEECRQKINADNLIKQANEELRQKGEKNDKLEASNKELKSLNEELKAKIKDLETEQKKYIEKESNKIASQESSIEKNAKITDENVNLKKSPSKVHFYLNEDDNEENSTSEDESENREILKNHSQDLDSLSDDDDEKTDAKSKSEAVKAKEKSNQDTIFKEPKKSIAESLIDNKFSAIFDINNYDSSMDKIENKIRNNLDIIEKENLIEKEKQNDAITDTNKDNERNEMSKNNDINKKINELNASQSTSSDSSSSSSSSEESSSNESDNDENESKTTNNQQDSKFLFGDLSEDELQSPKILNKTNETKKTFEVNDKLLESMIDTEIDEYIKNEIENKYLNEYIADKLINKLVPIIFDDVIDEASKERKENVINLVYNDYLSDAITSECRTIAATCCKEEINLNREINNYLNGIINEITEHVIRETHFTQTNFDNYSNEILEKFLNDEITSYMTNMCNELVSKTKNLNSKANYIYESIIDNFMKNEIEILCTSVYVNELKARKDDNNVNSIFDFMKLKPIIEPMKDFVQKVSHEKIENICVDDTESFDIPIKKTTSSSRIISSSSESSSSSSDESAEGVSTVSKLETQKASTSTFQQKRLQATVTQQQQQQQQRQPTIRTLKDQMHFLNSIKKSESSVSSSVSSTSANKADIISLIKAKKRILEEDLSKKFQNYTPSHNTAKLISIDSVESKNQSDKSSLKRKRNIINTETKQLTISTVTTPPPLLQSQPQPPLQSPSPLSKRYHTQMSTPSTPALSESSILMSKVTSTPAQETTKHFLATSSTALSVPSFEQMSPLKLKSESIYIKKSLSIYFKTFNVKQGFRFEELDKCIERFTEPKTEFSVDLFVFLVIKHFLNNFLIPVKETTHELTKEHFPLHSHHSHHAQLIIRITNEEEKYVYLINKIKECSRFTHIYYDIINKLKTMLLTNNFNDFYNLRLARMICYLCRSNKDFNLMRIIIYDIIYTRIRNFHLIFVTFARIWPKCLESGVSGEASNNTLESSMNISINGSDNISPILCVIMYLTRNEIINVENTKQNVSLSNTSDNEFQANRWKYYSLVFEKLCNWQLKFSGASEVYSFLMPNLKSNEIFTVDFKTTPKAFEYILAFKLLCKYEGWKWSWNVFIKQIISNMLAKWIESKQKHAQSQSINQQTPIDDSLIAFFLLLQAHIIAHICPNEEKNTAIEAIRSFSLFLKEQNFTYCSLIIQYAAIEGLLLLVPYDPTTCFTEIQIWYKQISSNLAFAFNNSISQLLKNKIKVTYNMYKSKLPNYLVISI